MIKEVTSPRFVESAEETFYSHYAWCLNPILTLSKLFPLLREELVRFDSPDVDWKRKEVTTNIYLFVNAIACTVDDYLVWRPLMLSRFSYRYPRLRWILTAAEWIADLPYSLRTMSHRHSVLLWRSKWQRCVELACELLVYSSERNDHRRNALRAEIQQLQCEGLLEGLLRRRMKLHEGFRCQDMTHHDVFSMADLFLQAQEDSKKPVIVVGLRTAGAYFAPLIKAYLLARGWESVSCINFRPRMGLSRSEEKTLRQSLAPATEVLVVDDYPNSGYTLKFTLDILRRHGAERKHVTVVVPKHPYQFPSSLTELGATVLTLEHKDLYKHRLLGSHSFEELICEYFHNMGYENVRVLKNQEVDSINAGLWQHYADGFQVRLKRVFEVQAEDENRMPVVKRVIAKSVGWGWLGYHSYIAGRRLVGFVPTVVGLRDGFLISEFLENTDSGDPVVADAKIQRFGSYIAKRVERLRLDEDPRIGYPDLGWGWLEIVSLLRRAYGVNLGRMKDRSILKTLRKIMVPVPTLTDGRMRPEEWLGTNGGLYKVDYEHHNFGAPEFDVVDPAYDLASTIFEFQLDEHQEEELVQKYQSESGDQTVRDRLLLYKLLYGMIAMRKSAEVIPLRATRSEQEQLNTRYLSARDFLIYTMSVFYSRRISVMKPEWLTSLFFLDLDGAFDNEVLGFPHTTPSGMYAISLLQSQDYSVVLNTGRCVEHVRNYCRAYGFPGGIGEYGSVFFDAVENKEIPLIDSECLDELACCRTALQQIPGVFIDQDYRYSTRAFRYNGFRTIGLQPEELKILLRNLKSTRLTYIARSEDTYIVQQGTGKARAMQVVKDYLGYKGKSAAIGDSDEDCEMLRNADFGYAPANCLSSVRTLAKDGKCKIMSRAHQQGLYDAVQDLCHTSLKQIPIGIARETIHDVSSLMINLLHVAEQPRRKRVLAAANPLDLKQKGMCHETT